MAVTEKIELLGKGLYGGEIPDVLTLKSLPTTSELDYVGSEDFHKTMVEIILPQAIEEPIDCKKLLYIDYLWVCRCLRILNYGPYLTVNSIMCPKCRQVSRGEYLADFRLVDCTPIPEGFKNDVVVTKDEFIDYDGDIHLKLPTVQDILNAKKDTAFKDASGETNISLAWLCYSIKSIKGRSTATPLEFRTVVMNDLSPADYKILTEAQRTKLDFGLRAGGPFTCPKCHSEEASFFAPVDELFFRPSMGALQQWKADRNRRPVENSAGNTKPNV